MTRQKRRLTPEEAELWRRVAEAADPQRKKALTDAGISKPDPAVVEQSARIALTRKTPAPQNRSNERRVRRGKIDIGGTLDLHGHTQASAEVAVSRFLRVANARGARAVIVVTGVGRRRGEGVLKRRLPEWLEANRAIVSGFAPAHRAHGGEGATYVFLRRPSED